MVTMIFTMEKELGFFLSQLPIVSVQFLSTIWTTPNYFLWLVGRGWDNPMYRNLSIFRKGTRWMKHKIRCFRRHVGITSWVNSKIKICAFTADMAGTSSKVLLVALRARNFPFKFNENWRSQEFMFHAVQCTRTICKQPWHAHLSWNPSLTWDKSQKRMFHFKVTLKFDYTI